MEKDKNLESETYIEKAKEIKKTGPTAALKLISGDSISIIPLDKESFTIGRSSGCCLSIDVDPKVSRIHCRILKVGDTFILEDLGSSNGTKVNNMSITKKILEENDIIQIGRTKLQFSFTKNKS